MNLYFRPAINFKLNFTTANTFILSHLIDRGSNIDPNTSGPIGNIRKTPLDSTISEVINFPANKFPGNLLAAV